MILYHLMVKVYVELNHMNILTNNFKIKIMKNIKFNLPLIVALLLLTTISYAQQRPDKPEGRRGYNHGMKAWMEIGGLSEDQKESIKAIHLKTMKANQSIRNEIGEKEARMNTLSSVDNPKKTEIMSIASEIADLRKKLFLARVETRLAVRELLTDDQKLIFDNKRHHKRHHMGTWNDR